MGLILWLPFTKDTNNQGLDGSLSFSLNSLSQDANGKLGNCYKGCAVYHTDPDIIGNAWTITTWVKASSWSANNDILACKNIAGSDHCQFYFSVINGATYNLGINTGSSTTTYGYTFNTNQWYHLAATYDGSKYTMYINGNSVKTGTCSNTAFTDCANIGVGCRSTNTNGTSQTGGGGNKYFNDFRLYDTALSPREIKEISKGKILHYTLSDPYNEKTTNLLPSNLQNFSVTNYDALSFSYNTSQHGKYTLSGYLTVQSTSDWVNPRMTITGYYSDGTNIIIASNSNIKKDGVEHFIETTGQTDTSKTLVAIKGWILDHSSGGSHKDVTGRNFQLEFKDHSTPYTSSSRNDTTVYDVSGFGYNGTASGVAYSSDTPKYNISTFFKDGAGIFGHPNITLSQFTITFWGKHTVTGKMLFGSNSSPTNYNGDWYWYGDNSFKFPLGEYYYTNNAGSATALLNTWTHFSAVYDGTKLVVYRNGIYEGEKAFTGNVTLQDISIGRGLNSNYQEDGYVSDFRLYATALSADDVLELYNTPQTLTNSGALLTQGEYVEV